MKSRTLDPGGLYFGVNRVSFGGTCTLTVADGTPGRPAGAGSASPCTFRVDAIDNGEPGAGRDSYDITIHGPSGAPSHQAGTSARPLPLGGGNIAVQNR
ncbi:MAG: hypothetical protein M3179_05520 [Actinomycetota bacterium]|nr:hypothetical protein [Actinomycetota bacterium]